MWQESRNECDEMTRRIRIELLEFDASFDGALTNPMSILVFVHHFRLALTQAKYKLALDEIASIWWLRLSSLPLTALLTRLGSD